MAVVELYNQSCVLHLPPQDVVQCVLDLVGCTCTKSTKDPDCPGEFAFVPYAPLCRKLGLDPRIGIYSALDNESTRHPLTLLFPWEETTNNWDIPPWDTLPPVKPESSYGNKSDFESDVKPFGWVDHVHPVLLLPIHYHTPGRVGLIQLH